MLATILKNRIFAAAFIFAFCILSKTGCNAANYSIEAIKGTEVFLGEGPHWKFPNLYYADLATGEVARYDSITKKTYKCQIVNHRQVSFIIPYEHSDTLFAVGLKQVAAQIYWNGFATKCRIVKKLFEVETENSRDIHNCLNDGKCDARGRLFTGTALCGQNDYELSRNLYRFADGRLERILTNVNFSNGMAWNYKRKEYYYIDSGRNPIIRFDYDLKTGRVANPNVVFHLDISGYPPNESGWTMLDGMTTDAAGDLYVVVFGTKEILKICTRKWSIIERIVTPCKFISSATFGGAEYNELYVTSLNLGVSSPSCGSVFRIKGFKVGGLPSQSIRMSYKLEPIPNGNTLIGEGPHWDIETQSLYFVDIDVAKLLRYDYQQNKTYSAVLEGEKFASFIVPVEGENGKFVVGCDRRIVIVDWDGVSSSANVKRVAYEVQPGEEFNLNRLNDGKADPRGRLFAGTMYNDQSDLFSYRKGELYRFEKGKPVQLIKSDVGISNGLTWNVKTNKFYFIDSADYDVKEYDYDLETGVASNPRVVFKHPSHLPDGMTIDSEGNIYIATFTGHTIYKVNPSTTEILLEIKFPCKQITSAAFGGPNLDILYVTTSRLNDQPAPAGDTFKVTGLGVKGLPMTKARV